MFKGCFEHLIYLIDEIHLLVIKILDGLLFHSLLSYFLKIKYFIKTLKGKLLLSN